MKLMENPIIQAREDIRPLVLPLTKTVLKIEV